MVRALLEGRKTQTRRALKPKPGATIADATVDAGPALGGIAQRMDLPADMLRVPYAVGDRLWVKEGFATGHPDHMWGSPIFKATFGAMLAPVCEGFTPWKSPLFMPRALSRLTLLVTAVRVERLQQISRADAAAEGVAIRADDLPYLAISTTDPWPDFANHHPPEENFAALWRHIHGPISWALNPWVAAITFEVVKANIDAPAPADGSLKGHDPQERGSKTDDRRERNGRSKDGSILPLDPNER